MGRISVTELTAMKARGEKIAMLTSYDYPTAKLLDEAGIPVMLVGDSLGMAVLGYDSTLPVTVDDIIHHTRAVVRGSKRALIVADMPFMSYQVSIAEAMTNAGRLMREGGAGAVKLEGGARVVDTVRHMTEAGIPVMGHLGLTPQSVHQLGGYRVQAKAKDAADQLVEDALALEEAGAFAIVLEVIPADLSRRVSERLVVPTIGIGAGPYCDGQVQVITDILALQPDFTPRHAKIYAPLGEAIRQAANAYMNDVQGGSFPTAANSFGMKTPAQIEKLY